MSAFIGTDGQRLADTLSAMRPRVGVRVKVTTLKGKNRGKVGVVVWHGRNKFDTVTFRYCSDSQAISVSCEGRAGIVSAFALTTAIKFFTSTQTKWKYFPTNRSCQRAHIANKIRKAQVLAMDFALNATKRKLAPCFNCLACAVPGGQSGQFLNAENKNMSTYRTCILTSCMRVAFPPHHICAPFKSDHIAQVAADNMRRRLHCKGLTKANGFDLALEIEDAHTYNLAIWHDADTPEECFNSALLAEAAEIRNFIVVAEQRAVDHQ